MNRFNIGPTVDIKYESSKEDCRDTFCWNRSASVRNSKTEGKNLFLSNVLEKSTKVQPAVVVFLVYCYHSRNLEWRFISGGFHHTSWYSKPTNNLRVVWLRVTVMVSCNVFCLKWYMLSPVVCNGNRTEWSPIRSVIIRVITKSDDRAAGVRFVYHEYDYRPNWTTRSPITN